MNLLHRLTIPWSLNFPPKTVRKLPIIIPNAKGSPIDPTNRGGVVTKIGIDATRPLKGRFPQINFSEGLGGIDLSKIFQES